MKANLKDQQTLLAISEIDLALVKNQTDRARLQGSDSIQVANQKVLELSDLLIDHRNAVGELELELKRSENDMELVESRIAKDKQRLAATTSAKDAQGIEHELESLAKRQSELEDFELNIMELLEQAKKQLEVTSAEKQKAEHDVAEQNRSFELQFRAIEQENSSLNQKHQQLVSTLSPELAEVYRKKASRSVAVGRLTGRECGACRLTITATNLDEINALPADEIAECPNCQAFLVRA